MRSYIAYIKSTLRLTLRDRMVLFFNYLFPLIFFLTFAEGFGGKTSSGSLAQVISMVLMFGVLGTGFFGGGIRATLERETNILRRFKVAPITPAPILVASIVTGWAVFLPSVFFFLILAKVRYGMEMPANLGSLLIIVSAGVFAFRSVGLIIAAVANSMAESQIIIQLLYLPMLMLSGATVPLSIMPEWLQSVSQFLPSTNLYLGTQGILVRGETIFDNLGALASLLLTLGVSLFIAIKLFRWEKEEKLKPAAKLWVVAVLAPFIFTGAWQAHTKSNLRKTQMLTREMKRAQTWLIHDARIFVGDGRVIDSAAILIRNGRIEQIFQGSWPKPDELKAEAVQASGRTVMPALIDSGVNLMLPGTGAPASDYGKLTKQMERELASYVYCGVGAVRTVPDPMGIAPTLQRRVESGEIPGAEVFISNPDSVAPSLVASQVAAGDLGILKDTLLQQILPASEKAQLLNLASKITPNPGPYQQAVNSLKALAGADVAVAPLTRSGALFLPHGPAIHRELKLWVEAGIPAKEALRAATFVAAQKLGAANRLGLIQPGYEATLIIVEGNPLDDISATGRINLVLSKGERVFRQDILERALEKDREEKK